MFFVIQHIPKPSNVIQAGFKAESVEKLNIR
jgi:hypothetical protein